MRETRSSILLIVSLLLFLMSFVILCTWGYNEYYRKKDEKKVSVALSNDSANIAGTARKVANATRDSLQKIFNTTIENLDKRFDSKLNYADSLRQPLNRKLSEFFALKDEISRILKNRNNDADLEVARRKINELQSRINELIGRNTEVEQENKRLADLIKQLSAEKTTEQPIRTVSQENRPVAENAGMPENSFQAYDLRLSAIMVTDNKELETYQAIQTDKFVGSFIVKNNKAVNKVAELYIVITQPDGQVLQKSSWESGTFETLDGRKVYSGKMRFDYTRGEPKKLLFTLPGEKFTKGNYTMQVYYNGSLIGKIIKTLS